MQNFFCKMGKILIIFFITICLFLVTDILFFYYMDFHNRKFIQFHEKLLGIDKHVIPKYSLKLKPFSHIPNYNEPFRPIMNEDSKLNPILIFGCSFAYGDVFENEETISYVLSKYSKRPIINRAANSWGIQHMYYQLNEESQYFKSLHPPKYIFYVLINDHFRRLYGFSNMHSKYYLTYKIKNNLLVKKEPFLNLYYDFAIFRHIKEKYIFYSINNSIAHNKHWLFDFFIFHVMQINDLIKENWGGVENDSPKFIILAFENTFPEFWEYELEKNNIDVIEISKLINKTKLDDPKYDFFEPKGAPFAHPVGRLWEEVVPELKKKYPDL